MGPRAAPEQGEKLAQTLPRDPSRTSAPSPLSHPWAPPRLRKKVRNMLLLGRGTPAGWRGVAWRHLLLQNLQLAGKELSTAELSLSNSCCSWSHPYHGLVVAVSLASLHCGPGQWCATHPTHSPLPPSRKRSYSQAIQIWCA